MSDLFKEFEWRGQVAAATEGARELLAREQVTAYSGFDPTASSLHVGHLVPIMALKRVQKFGHTPIALIGGGTGLIGDPSGKSAERVLLSKEDVQTNVDGIRAQLSKLLVAEPGAPTAKFVDNSEWLTKMGAMEFLRDVGKFFTINYLLSKESVKRRLESEDGISYTEFSYSLLQAYDFLVLHDRFGCTLQVGGGDQWGNIVAGCDLIRKLRGKSAHGVVMPLLMTASGTKFGKTEAGTVWLDPARTSEYRFYQFWLNTDDRDVVAYLKYFTFQTQAEIAELERATRKQPAERAAQRELAREVTAMVHGKDGLEKAKMHTAALFGLQAAAGLPPDVGPDSPAIKALKELGEDLADVTLDAKLFPKGIAAVDLAVRAGLATSKSEATRLIQQGGLYINEERLLDSRAMIEPAFLTSGAVFRLRKGQRERRIVKIQA